MREILYIGNHISNKKGYPSVAETMKPLLLPNIKLILVSNKKNKILRILEMIFSTIKFGNRKSPLIIDVYSTQNFYYALAVSTICKIFNFKYICVLHGGNLPSRLRKNKKMSNYLFSRASNLIAPSKYLQYQFKNEGYQVEIIPNFIFLENYKFKHRKSITPRILWVRAFDKTYNPILAIKTFYLVLKKYPEAVLCMVGPEKDDSKNECIILANMLKISNRITFTGALPKSEWISLSSNYDIFINTTNFDNMPVSVIEAMALGMAVISTNVGGLPFLLKSSFDSILVPPNDENAFYNEICNLIENKKLGYTISLNARNSAECYAWENVKQEWMNILSI